MTKNEIYEHLARVYIGKSEIAENKKKRSIRPSFIGKILVMILLLAGTFAGLSAFLSKRNVYSSNRIIFALSNGPLRVKYNLNDPYPQVKRFLIPIPQVDTSKYSDLNFSIRGLEDGFPGIVKVVLKNKKNEEAFYFIDGVGLKWKKVSIPLNEFDTITDWTSLSDLAFVLEAWNTEKRKGIILIEDVCFAG